MNRKNRQLIALFFLLGALLFCGVLYGILSAAEHTGNYFKWEGLNQLGFPTIVIGLTFWLVEEYQNVTKNGN